MNGRLPLGTGWPPPNESFRVFWKRSLLSAEPLDRRGEVLDDNLYTAPGRYGGGGAGTTWLVGSAEEVARSLQKYRDLGVTTFVLSDTPYLAEIGRQGEQLLPLLRDRGAEAAVRSETVTAA